ncbi:MAG: hypothetical protein WCW56_03510 [Candidatus Paceibacterota bacterium]|jgi:hypothetical protein
MNKILVIVLVIALVLILGLGIYQLVKAPSLPESTTLPIAAGTGGEDGFTTAPATDTAQ